MSKSIKIFVSLLLCAVMLFSLISCTTENIDVRVDEDGYVVVNGERTDIMAATGNGGNNNDGAGDNPDGGSGDNSGSGTGDNSGTNTNPGTNTKPGTNTNPGTNTKPGTTVNPVDEANAQLLKSAYNSYKAEHTDYKGDYSQWCSDMAAGNLKEKYTYNLIKSGAPQGTTKISGTATTESGVLKMSKAILSVNNPVVLPIGNNASWEISFKGTLLPGGSGGGQIVTSNYSSTDAKFYIGINGGKGIIFIGVAFAGVHANYCFSVAQDTMKGNHTYTIGFENNEYVLRVDGGAAVKLSSVNINQNNNTEGASKDLSKELTSKIRALSGQDYIKITSIGSANNKELTGNYSSLRVETSSKYTYENLTSHPLSDLKIYYLGSSVTKGYDKKDDNDNVIEGNNGGKSFADYTALITGGTFKKEVYSGTTLAVRSDKTTSYVERITKLNLSKDKPDVLVVQLSTNDFQKSISTGSVDASVTASSKFNTKTITGAIEYIIAYTKEQSPNTKVIFYSCPLESEFAYYTQYKSYTNGILKEVQKKWSDTVYILDLFNSNHIQVPSYMMSDHLHPMKEGNTQVFVPKLINFLLDNIKK